MNSTPGQAALRRHRFDEPGRIYLVTTTTHQRQARFATLAACQAACQIIDHPDTWKSSRLLTWVLMPDHWHGLIELGDYDRLADAMRRFKGRSARAVNQADRLTGPVWAQAFHDHFLRREEDVLTAARYVINNPVRAGLVDRMGDYPYWNSVWLDQTPPAFDQAGQANVS